LPEKQNSIDRNDQFSYWQDYNERSRNIEKTFQGQRQDQMKYIFAIAITIWLLLFAGLIVSALLILLTHFSLFLYRTTKRKEFLKTAKILISIARKLLDTLPTRD
jgi:hypothetical protein